MTLFHGFSVQQEHQDLLFISSQRKESDRVSSGINCKYIMKLFNILMHFPKSHQKLKKQCKYIILTLLFLCQFLNFQHTSLAHSVEASNNLQPPISLRRVSVPIFSSQSSYDDGRYDFKIVETSKLSDEKQNNLDKERSFTRLNYSPNNRGFEPKSNFRFGERTKYPMSIFKGKQRSENRRDEPSMISVGHKLKDNSNVVWSQPDPRKTYSIPIELVEVPKPYGRLELARKLKIGEYPSRGFLASSNKRSSEHRHDFVDVIRPSTGHDNNHSSATIPERDEELQHWRSSREGDLESDIEARGNAANRRKSYQTQANMVTLIRYLPVLMSVPAEQVVVAATATAPDKSGVVVGGSLRASAIKTAGNPNLVGLEENPISSATTSSPLPAATYYRLYRPSLPTIKYQLSTSSQQEDLSGKGQNYPSVVDLTSTVSPNQSNLSPSSSSSIQANTLVGDFEIPADYAAASSLSAQYPQTGFFVQPAGSSAHETTISSPFVGSKFGQLNPGNQQFGQHSSGHSGPSKAISAYASKLISMLRPSSLLASIGPSPASSATTSAAFYTMPSMSQPQIYLLAPAETVLPQHSPGRPSPSSQLVKPEDLLLNQATKLHSTTKLSSYSQQQQPQQQQNFRGQNTDWIHQQPNGLICVHSLIQGGSKMSAQATNQEQKQPIFGGSEQHQQATTTTTSVPILSNQQTTDIDQSSFDYIPAPASSTTEYTPIGQKQQFNKQQSGKLKGKQNSVQFNKESPVKLAQKLSKKLKTSQVAGYNGFDSTKDSAELVQEHLSDDFGDKQTEQQQKRQYQQQSQHQYQQQPNFLGSSSESRSVIDDNQVGKKRTEEQPASIKYKSQVERGESVRRSHDNVSSLVSKKSIIPFTIKDKIDLPTRRGHHFSGRHSNTSSISGGNSIQANLNTNNPVEYDEPSEGEIELQTTSNGAGKPHHSRQLHRYSWPAHLLSNSNNNNNQDERRVKTSFISASSSQSPSLRPPKRKVEKDGNLALELNNIDYSKENSVSNGRRASSLDAGYTLPLLMASSTSLGSSASSSPTDARFKSTRKLNENSWQQKGTSSNDLESEHQGGRHEAEASNEMRQPAFMRPSVVFRVPPPVTTTTTTTSASTGSATLSPTTNPDISTESATVAEGIGTSITVSSANGNELHGLNAAASSSVTTSSTLDGQPVILNSGRLSSHSLDNSNAKLVASNGIDSNELPPGFLLVSSSSLSSSSATLNNNNNSSNNNITQNKQDETSAKRIAANQTVELLVNSSPHEQGTNGSNLVPPLAVARSATVRRRYSTEKNGDSDRGFVDDKQGAPLLKGGLKADETTDFEVDNKNKSMRRLENHSLDGSSENKAFSNFRLISAESPAEEFAKLSESLQTNPLDLIDLQNSRSNFELPSQLESLSMLFSSSSSSPDSSSSKSPTSSLASHTQSKQHLSAPNYRERHQHGHQNENQASSSDDDRWPSSIDTTRNRRASGPSHARRLR